MAKAKRKKKNPERTISAELFTQWTRLRRTNDIKLLVELTGKSAPTINRALAYGHVNNAELITKINNFFIERDNDEKKNAEVLTKI